MDDKIFESLAKAQHLVDRINSNIAEVQNTGEYSYRLIEQSHKVLDIANRLIHTSIAQVSKGQR